MPRLTSFGVFLLSVALLGCQEKQYQVVDLPDSPDGRLNVRAFVLDETASIKISGGPRWNDFNPLIIGQCSGVKFYWAGPRQAVVVYDTVQIAQFLSSPRYFAGADVSFCKESSGTCQAPQGAIAVLPGCDEAGRLEKLMAFDACA